MRSADIFQAGAARAVITPKPGIRLAGYAVREGVSTAVDQPLTLTVLALQGGGEMVLLAAIDLCLIDLRFATALRRSCARVLGIPDRNVLVNASHSHSTPGIGSYVEFDTPAQLALQAKFWRQVLRGAKQAARKAVAEMRPARISVGWGECAGNINRRQKTAEGGILLGENPAGPCDRSVGVLRVDREDGRPIAVAFRYSCHTVTRGPKTSRISPDFAGPARGIVESALGCPSLFLQGCAGNLNPASGIGQDAEESPLVNEDMRRLGQILGGEVLKVAQNLRTHRRRAEPELVRSVALYWLYKYEPIPAAGTGRIVVRQSALEMPLAPFPDLREVEREHAEWAERLRVASEGSEPEWKVNPLKRFEYWGRGRLEAARRGPNPLTLKFPVQSFEIGGLRIVALPFEVMAETGGVLRDQLGPDTFVLGYSNGIISYLPTPSISAEGGMEARLGYKSYLVPSEVPGEWEPKIREMITSQFAQTP